MENSVFYVSLFVGGEFGGLTVVQRMVYSYLVRSSLIGCSGCYVDGVMSGDGVRRYLVGSGWRVPMVDVPKVEIARALNCTVQTVVTAYRVLCSYGFIADAGIMVPESVIGSEYFRLYIDDRGGVGCRLSGLTLLVYSFIRHRAELRGSDSIDTWRYALCDVFGLKDAALRYHLGVLYAGGYIRRVRVGGHSRIVVVALERR